MRSSPRQGRWHAFGAATATLALAGTSLIAVPASAAPVSLSFDFGTQSSPLRQGIPGCHQIPRIRLPVALG